MGPRRKAVNRLPARTCEVSHDFASRIEFLGTALPDDINNDEQSRLGSTATAGSACCHGPNRVISFTAKEPVLMLQTEVMLDWACCVCGNPMGATLKCEGAGLADKTAKAYVKVPCPSCHQNNQLIFSPDDGALDEVFAEAEPVRYRIPVPSYN